MKSLDALEYAHQHGIVHRDVKPENILLHGGHAMVADFGIALAVSAAAGGRMTETGLSLGTPFYMSPEQATAEKEITARSDVYSLGSVLYEMLTGNPPFVGAAAQQIIMKIITEPAEPVTKYRKSVPPNVAAAVAKALEKLPADRFESAKAFADALASVGFRGTEASGAAGGGPVRAGSRWVLPAAGMVLLALGGAIGALLAHRAPVAPQVVRFTTPMKSGQRLALSSGTDTPFALSPDGSRIAFVAVDSGASVPSLHVRSLDQFNATTFPGTEGAANPFFSPDGLWIGFITNLDRAVRKVAASGGPVSQVATGAGFGFGAPSWGDDHSIVYPTQLGRTARVRDGGGTPTILLDSTKVKFAISPVVLPGSRAVLLSVCKDQGDACAADLAVLDVATGKTKVLVQNAARGWYLPSGHLVYGTKDGALFAVKFDVKSLSVTSAPVAMLDGIDVSRSSLARVAISASGTMAYVPAAGSSTAVVVQVDRAGREEVIVTKPGPYSQPRLSPDGRRLSLTMPDAKQASQIWIHDRSTGTTRQLTFEGESERSAWSPDGSRVAFFTSRAGKGYVWWAPADGSGPGERAGDGLELTGAAAISWTRDGKWIVWDGGIVGAKGAGSDDIYAIPLSGAPGKVQSAVATPAQEQTGEVSPDGKWIAYVSNDAGKNQIYIQPFLAPGGRTLVSAGAAAEPVWASNNELVFVNTAADSVTSARLEFGATVKVTRTALFDRRPYLPGSSSQRNFDVSRDGKSFVFVKPTGQRAGAEPVVVVNWVEEVKRLMAAAGIRP